MLSDPQVLTVNSVGRNLVRINQDQYSSEYLLRNPTNEWRLKIRNSAYLDKARRVMIDRHNVEFTETVFPVAPATLSTVRKTYFVIENQQGDTLADPTYDAAALFAWATASSNAMITRLMNSES